MFRRIFQTNFLIEAILRFRWVWIGLTLLISGWFLSQLPHLVLDGSMERIMLKDDPERIIFDRSSELFGPDEALIVAISYPETVWNESAIRELADLSADLRNIEGVKGVNSLSDSLVVRRQIYARARSLLEWLDDGVEMKKLRFAALTDATIRDNLVTKDGLHAGLTIRLVSLEGKPVGYKARVTDDIRRVVQSHVESSRFHLSGWPVVHTEIARYMLRDLMVLIPLVALVVTLLLVVTYRRWAGVLLPMATIGLAQIWTVGGLVMAGRSMSMVTNSLPVIIIAIGTTYCIHVVSHIFRALETETDRESAVRRAVEHTVPSIIMSSLTTMVGFGALKFSPVDSIDEFGTFAVWGIGVSAVLTILFLPSLALVVPLKKGRISDDPSHPEKPVRPFAPRFLDYVLSQRRVVWIGAVATIVISAYGLSRIQVETAPVSWFPADSQTRAAVDYVNANMAGMTPFNVVIDSGEPDGATNHERLKRLEEFQRWLLEQPEVDTAISIVDPIKVVYRVTSGRRGFQLPSDQNRVDRVLKLVRSGDNTGTQRLLSADGRAANVIIRTPLVSTLESTAFTDRVNAYLGEHFADALLARVTGSAHLSYRTNLFFTSGIATTLGIGMGAICLIMVLLFRSWKLGLLAMVPNLLPVLVNYSILGLLDMNLNSATSITGCIAIGIAVDDTIHFLMAFRHGRKKALDHDGPNHTSATQSDMSHVTATRSALEFGLAHVGRPMLITSCVLSCGFAVLLFSSFSPVASLGLLVAASMLACLVCDTIFLPVLLTTSFALASKPAATRQGSTAPSTTLVPQGEYQ